MTVSARTAAPAIAKVLVKARGWNIFPSCPSSMKTGVKESSTMSSEKKMGRPTCLAETSTVSR
ncbi:hypothetical protein D3C87_2024310 [compost metagenome]